MGGCVPRPSGNIIKGNQLKSDITTTSTFSSSKLGGKQHVPSKLKKVISPLDLNYRIIQKYDERINFTMYKIQEKSTGDIKSLIAVRKSSIIPNNEANFKNEIDQLTNIKLDNVNLFKVYEYFIDDCNFLLVCEYFVGNDLYDTISKFQTYSIEVIHVIFLQICNAVKSLHEILKTGSFDLHPCNIFLSVDDSNSNISQRFQTKVLYISNKYLKSNYIDDFVPYYLPPEFCSLKTRKFNNPKSDIWSIGVLLHILLDGYPLFLGDNHADIKAEIQKGEPELLKNVVDPMLSSLLYEMIELNEGKRFSIKEVIESEWVTQIKSTQNYSLPNLKLLEQVRTLINQELFIINIVGFIQKLSRAQAISKELTHYYEIDSSEFKSYNELRYGFEMIFGPSLADFELDKALLDIEMNKEGKVEYNKFLNSYINTKMIKTKENLIRVFNSYHKVTDGKLKFLEVKYILKKVFSDKIVKIMDYHDHNSQDNISGSDLVDILNKLYT